MEEVGGFTQRREDFTQRRKDFLNFAFIMKRIFVEYASYHKWATELFMKTILDLPEELHHVEVKSSFPGLYNTVLHLDYSDKIWWHRLNPAESSDSFNNTTVTMHELFAGMQQRYQLWMNWINALDENDFTKNVHYKSLKGIPFSQPLYQVLLHIFNHATYHRGQLVTILRQLDVQNIPQTDFIAWSR